MKIVNSRLKDLNRNKAFLLMLLPGTLFLLVFSYLPMVGTLISFKKMTFFKSNIFANFANSDWVGLKNFEFFFKSPNAFNITRNTVGYNLIFIAIGLMSAVFCAIALNEIRSRFMAKFYQTVMFLPYFISWIVVSYLLYSLLNPELGLINTFLGKLGIEGVSWYSEPRWWPFIFVILHVWKHVGYSTVIYLAAISGIDTEMYEAAAIDGATKIKQIRHITIPSIVPVMIILTILNLGKIFTADFGLFWNSTLQLGQGALYSVGHVIDTYVYIALIAQSNMGMAAAIGLYQAVVGFILIMITNYIVKKISPDNTLF